MNIFYYIFLIIFISYKSLFAQWYIQESGTTADLRGVWFVDSLNGWACGDSGIVLHTSNGGQVWERQNSGVNIKLEDIFFVDDHKGWAVGDNGKIINTTNGGLTWTSQISGTTNLLRSVYFLDSYYGWVVGDSITICSTTDGGVNWMSSSTGTSSLFDVYIANFSTIIITGEGIINKTINGGATWTNLVVGSTENYYALSFIDPNVGTVIGGNGTIMKTSDGGNTFVNQFSGTSNDLLGISFTDSDNGTITGTLGIILRTSDGGNSWINQKSGTMNDLWGVYFVDVNIGIVVGFEGTILRTENGSIPVELISFTANVTGSDVLLSWETATETNNQGFEVERQVGSPAIGIFADFDRQSAVGNENSEWEEIGFVEGYGTTTEPRSYSFKDENLTTGKYSYRLKQLDYDGTFEYSDVVEVGVEFTPKEIVLYQNYPNPFNPSTVIRYQLPVSSNVTLKVYDVLGNEVATLADEYKEAGSYEVELDASKLSSGIYIYQLEASGFSKSKKITLIK